jgi:hypothetical protein
LRGAEDWDSEESGRAIRSWTTPHPRCPFTIMINIQVLYSIIRSSSQLSRYYAFIKVPWCHIGLHKFHMLPDMDFSASSTPASVSYHHPMLEYHVDVMIYTPLKIQRQAHLLLTISDPHAIHPMIINEPNHKQNHDHATAQNIGYLSSRSALHSSEWTGAFRLTL